MCLRVHTANCIYLFLCRLPLSVSILFYHCSIVTYSPYCLRRTVYGILCRCCSCRSQKWMNRVASYNVTQTVEFTSFFFHLFFIFYYLRTTCAVISFPFWCAPIRCDEILLLLCFKKPSLAAAGRSVLNSKIWRFIRFSIESLHSHLADCALRNEQTNSITNENQIQIFNRTQNSRKDNPKDLASAIAKCEFRSLLYSLDGGFVFRLIPPSTTNSEHSRRFTIFHYIFYLLIDLISLPLKWLKWFSQFFSFLHSIFSLDAFWPNFLPGERENRKNKK